MDKFTIKQSILPSVTVICSLGRISRGQQVRICENMTIIYQNQRLNYLDAYNWSKMVKRTMEQGDIEHYIFKIFGRKDLVSN